MSIQVIRLFAEERNRTRKVSPNIPTRTGIRILDALAATGLRSIRYLKEIPGVESVTINDLLPKATEAALNNVVRNEVSTDRSYFYLYLDSTNILVSKFALEMHVFSCTSIGIHLTNTM